MSTAGILSYQNSGEYNITELLAHFDRNYIFDILNDKLESISFSTSIIEPNIVSAFENTFKSMNSQYPGDSQNIRVIREQAYRDIISILTKRFNLRFNTVDDTIDLYTAAYYLYDFTVCNRNNLMINFFTAFIVNNKDSLSSNFNADDYRKGKDSALAYGKRIYDDQKFAMISANIANVIDYISTLDISLLNIFQSSYRDPNIVAFLDNAFADCGNFFKDFYCSILKKPEEMPIVITNIRLALQNVVGNISTNHIEEFLAYSEDQD
jgi:hypothetical protein